MIDQSFSAENFEKIFNIENRKGNINKDTLPAEYITLLVRIKEIRENINELRDKYRREEISKDDFLKERDAQNDKIKKLQSEKETILYENLKKISEEVNSSKFRFDFNVGDHKGKPTYEIGNNVAQFYAIKQLQYNIRKTFKVKQADRYRILKQIKLLLSDGFPKIVIRTDIESFYESIPQNKLLNKVLDSTLLTHKSKQFISNIITEYEKLKDKSLERSGYGVPRGVGISAYLSELYMSDFDRDLKSIAYVTFYARYVDDIFIIITPPSKTDDTDYQKPVEDICTKFGLTMKVAKTKVVKVMETTPKQITIDYLGYSFVLNQCKLTINLTRSKTEKYKDRIIKAFDCYNTGNNSKYCNLKQAILKHVIQKFENIELGKRRINTELTILLFDLLSCPFLDISFKKKLLSLYEVNSPTEQDGIISFSDKQKYWFTKWKDINLGRELNAKISLEVYS